MNPDAIAEFLRLSLSDRKLTGSEKTALAGWVEQHLADEQMRGLARHLAFNAARAESADPAAVRVIEWLEDVMKVLAPIGNAPVAHDPVPPSAEKDRACFSPGEGCLQLIIRRFEECRRTADLCVFTITDDRITRAILDSHRRGVKLRILSDHAKSGDLGSDMLQFRDSGIQVKLADVFDRSGPRRDGHMHHKFAIFDGERLINGSYNWTRGAANINFENLVDTANRDLIVVFAEEFKRLWNRF
jgi:phosphatidylserine/phosphatidylglycerophosphate/cardiolipin synthase-like enzyme